MATNIFKIGSTDFSDYVSALKVDKNYLTSDYSGRNAAGTMIIDVIASKYKLSVTFIPMTPAQVSALATAISGYADLSITFTNPYTNSTTTVTCYTGTPSIEWYRYSTDMKLTKPFTLSFIEM